MTDVARADGLRASKGEHRHSDDVYTPEEAVERDNDPAAIDDGSPVTVTYVTARSNLSRVRGTFRSLGDDEHALVECGDETYLIDFAGIVSKGADPDDARRVSHRNLAGSSSALVRDRSGGDTA